MQLGSCLDNRQKINGFESSNTGFENQNLVSTELTEDNFEIILALRHGITVR